LAVVIIISLAALAATGTIFEAMYNDSEIAQKLVYESPYMYIVLGLLSVNLIGVMVDRWPWKKHHAGFVLAHVGILLLLLGAWITHKYGVDGSMAFEVGEQSREITLKDRQLMIFGSLDGSRMQLIYDEPVDFLSDPPTEKSPYVVHIGADDMRFSEHYNFAFRESEFESTDSEKDGPAVRFQLVNPNINMTQWLLKEPIKERVELNLGPAQIVMSEKPQQPTGHNEIFLTYKPGRPTLDYAIYGKDRSLRKKGRIAQSETMETPWMGIKFRLLRFLPHAREVVHYVRNERSTPNTTSAVKFTFRGKEYWLGLDAVMPIYLEDRVYMVSYGHRRLRLKFPLKLDKFTVGVYQGTERAASYQSQVTVPGMGQVDISMNEPLKHDGFTFYQSSFQRNEKGDPVVSVLSVNRDPGRFVKYAGSLSIVLGSILLFYFKRGFYKKKGS
jgi:hypothetical protein